MKDHSATLVSRLLQQALQHPERQAVNDGIATITYSQLITRGRQLASWLISEGLQPEEPVVLFHHRTIEMVTDMVATLLAGGAWVPVSPDQPLQRVHQLLSEVSPRFVLSDSDSQVMLGMNWLGPQKKAVIHGLDSVQGPFPEVADNQLAYILFTSGSTGVPKGVMVENHSVVNMLDAFHQEAPIESPFNGLSVCPFVFDVSVWEFFSVLCYGGTLYLADPALVSDLPRFASFLKEHGIQSGYFPPGILDPLGHYLTSHPDQLQIQRLLVGVEPIVGETLERLSQLPSRPVIINGYGPTEATICATFFKYQPQVKPQQRVPIGQPLPGCEIILLDENNQPTADDAAGYMAIGGIGLARGYLTNDTLTAKLFVNIHGRRFYLTGDQARRLEDGNLVFGGRSDSQVKLRGHRIELGEIEATLQAMPGILAVAVVFLHHGSNPLLACFYQTTDLQDVPADAVRSWLTTHLPSYMVPHRMVKVAQFSRTPNGKIDRDVLLTHLVHDAGDPLVSLPGVSDTVAALWNEVTGFRPSSPHDDFFVTGGDSLRAMHLAARLTEACGVEVSIRVVFDNPTPVRLTDWLDQHQPVNLRIPETPDEPSDILPLVFTQQRPWLLFQLGGPSHLYNLPVAFRLTGEPDPDRLQRAFNEIIARHDAFRLSFFEADGKGYQKLHPQVDFHMIKAAIPAGKNQEAELDKYLTLESSRPFDPSEAPLLRVHLIRLAPGRHVLLIVTHHLVMDGWSWEIVMSELELYYNQDMADLSLTRLSGDGWGSHVLRQQRDLQADRFNAGIKFFERYLKHAPPFFSLPNQYPRPAEPSFRGDAVFAVAGNPLVAALERTANNHGVSSYMVLMATFGFWLHSLTRQRDFVTGTMSAAREKADILKTIGFFSDSLPIRFTIPEEATFSEWLLRVKENLLEVTGHRQVPFEWLLRKLNPSRDLSFHPVFQVMAVHQRSDKQAPEFNSLQSEALHLPYPGSKLDLTLYFNEYPGKLLLMAEFNTDLFDKHWMNQQLQNFVSLLDRFTSSPNLLLDEVNLVADPQLSELIRLSNSENDGFSFISINELIRERVIRTPLANAILFEGKAYNYQWLWDYSGAMAARIAKTSDPGQPVLLIGNRTPRVLASMLAIRRAGCWMVPVSRQLPRARIEFIIHDAGIHTVITDEENSLLLSDPTLHVLLVAANDLTTSWSDQPESPDSPAYCIYTSGTSGVSKGVVVTRGNMSNFVQAALRHYQITPSDKVLQFASLSFDASVEEIWPTWCAGATLVLRDDEMIASASHFLEQTEKLGITVLDLPTAYFHHLAGTVSSSAGRIPGCLRLVILGGEALQSAMVARWQQLPGGRPRLVNTYGPTETTVVCTWADIPDPVDNIQLMIGRPVDGVSVFVIDEKLRLVPVGVTGELLVGGRGVAQGYLNQADLTSRSFVEVPFAPGRRCYRTGDLVKMNQEGCLEFVGRADDQLKIRGFRVEPSEIERVVSGWPGINDVVVGVAHVEPHGPLLCCWYVAQQEADLGELRGWVEWQLPDYMVPAAWVRVEAIPLNASGKTDRGALPKPDMSAGNEAESDWQPSDQVQKNLAFVWSSVLGNHPSRPDENFFLCGGHSLLGAAMITAIKNQFGTDISLRAFFADPTFAGLEKLIREHHPENTDSLPPITPRKHDGLTGLSSSQYRIWFLEELEQAGSAFSIPLSFKIEGSFRPELFQKALNRLIAGRQILRSSVGRMPDGEPFLQLTDQAAYQIPVADLSALAPDKQITEMTLRIQRNERIQFDTSRWPLFRVSLIRLSDTSWVLLLNFHHLIADNRSVGLWVQQMSQLYNQLLTTDDAYPATEQPTYFDFVHWQKEWLAKPQALTAVEAWVEILRDAPAVLLLPTDRPRPAKQEFSGEAVTLTLSSELTRRLRDTGAHKGASLSAVLLSCFSALLYRYTNQDDMVIGVPVAGRNAPGSENLMGVTINNLPVRVKHKVTDTFWQLQERVRQSLLEAMSLQDVPFEKIVQALKLRPDMATTPVFQVMFNMLNAHDEELRFRGCSTEYVEPETHAAKYDLSLIVSEREGALWLTFEYATSLFDAATIRFLSRAFLTLASAVASSPSVPMKNFGLLNRGDEWHPAWRPPTRQSFPRQTLPDLFADTAGKYAEAPAIITGQRIITYREAADKVQMLASALFTVDCQPGSRIGVMVERNEWLPLALLAVMATGGCYVPLDPVFPPERIAAIVEDASIMMFVVSRATQRSLPPGRYKTIMVDDQSLRQLPRVNILPVLKMSAPAYTIFTSGSTGRPKGVVISHNSLVNFLWSILHEPGLSAGDKLLAVTTASFDIAALELFTPLIAGATLVIASDEEQHDARLLGQLISQHNITLMQATPATWRMMMLTGWQGSNNLTILCGGEALPSELAAQLLTRSKALWNMYGPTETTIWSTLHRISQPDPDKPFADLGHPVANNFIYITDENLNPLPPGVPGELLIGGEGVALGYLNQPQLTDSRFLPDPFDPTPGARLYRTGDLVKRRHDGSIEYLGRNDNQIKLRGFRIEPGDIENVLAGHPEVQQALVMLRDDNNSPKRLVAYLLKKREGLQPASSLKDFLSKKLPDYMIPSAFVWLDEFPLTPNGKIDRKALPGPARESAIAGITAEPPRDAAEAAMMDIWREVLGIHQLSANDDFFDLGGNSLMAVGLMAKIELKFKVRLPLASLFQHSTLRALTQHTRGGEKAMSWRSLVTIRPMGDKPPVFLIHGAGLNVLLYNTLVTHMPPDQPVYALQAKGLDGKEKPLETIEEIAAHYISEIRTVSPLGPFALAGFSLGGIIAFEMARQLKEMGMEAFFVGMFDTVAYTSDSHLSAADRKKRRARFRRNQIVYNLTLLLTDSWSHRSHLIGLKLKSFKRLIERVKLRQKEKKTYLTGDRANLQNFALPVHEVNNRAGERYHLKPSPVRIDLFKAKQQTFFIEEPKTYGWSSYASEGVVVHEVPGEHNTIFHPPHDKQFADELQRCIDEAYDRFLKKPV